MSKTIAQKLKKSAAHEAKRLARLSAMQALYQADIMQQSAVLVLKEFEAHRLMNVGGDMIWHDADTGDRLGSIDVMLMRDIVALALSHREAVENLISANLPAGWPYNRLEKPLQMILLAGAAELYQQPQTPVGAIISDYVDIAHAFYDDSKEKGMVNAVLDKVAKAVRS
ncbi:MAG: transcription antitermination factor NusB [Bdellovibrionales bacterium]